VTPAEAVTQRRVAASVRTHGTIASPLVRRDHAGADAIIDGNRWLAAARSLAFTHLYVAVASKIEANDEASS
jgi:ParB-like chromosome segregation protein Spo0J